MNPCVTINCNSRSRVRHASARINIHEQNLIPNMTLDLVLYGLCILNYNTLCLNRKFLCVFLCVGKPFMPGYSPLCLESDLRTRPPSCWHLRSTRGQKTQTKEIDPQVYQAAAVHAYKLTPSGPDAHIRSRRSHSF